MQPPCKWLREKGVGSAAAVVCLPQMPNAEPQGKSLMLAFQFHAGSVSGSPAWTSLCLQQQLPSVLGSQVLASPLRCLECSPVSQSGETYKWHSSFSASQKSNFLWRAEPILGRELASVVCPPSQVLSCVSSSLLLPVTLCASYKLLALGPPPSG